MTLYVVWANDRADALPRRLAVREQHRLRLRSPAPHPVEVVAGGPLKGGSPLDMVGTLLIIKASSVEAVRRFMADDPYVLNGVYERFEVQPWVCGMGPEEWITP